MGLVTTATLTAMLCLTCLASHTLQVMRQCGCFWSLLVSLSCSHYHLTFLPTLPNRIMATYTESAMKRAIRVLGKCYSAPSAQPISGWSTFTSEFIGQLDHQFSRRLIIKYSHQTDFLTLKTRLNNSERTEQNLTLAQTWWDELSMYTQSHVFIQCSIFEQGTDLTIEIYKESRRRKLLTLGRASEGDLLCQVSIKFDDLWKHLVSESQKTTKCELIFVSIASDILTAPQRSSRWISMMQFQGCISGSSLRYALNRFQHENSLFTFNQRLMTVTWALSMHKSRARWTSWMGSSPFWVVLDRQAMVWKWVLKSERLSAW